MVQIPSQCVLIESRYERKFLKKFFKYSYLIILKWISLDSIYNPWPETWTDPEQPLTISIHSILTLPFRQSLKFPRLQNLPSFGLILNATCHLPIALLWSLMQSWELQQTSPPRSHLPELASSLSPQGFLLIPQCLCLQSPKGFSSLLPNFPTSAPLTLSHCCSQEVNLNNE